MNKTRGEVAAHPTKKEQNAPSPRAAEPDSNYKPVQLPLTVSPCLL